MTVDEGDDRRLGLVVVNVRAETRRDEESSTLNGLVQFHLERKTGHLRENSQLIFGGDGLVQNTM